MDFDDKELIFVEKTTVKEGVICDVYKFINNDGKDLGVVNIKAGYQSPKQKVLMGDKTLQIWKSGKGSLEIVRQDGVVEVYDYPGSQAVVEVYVGDIMQWTADEDLEFYEVCYPAYNAGRFENLD